MTENRAQIREDDAFGLAVVKELETVKSEDWTDYESPLALVIHRLKTDPNIPEGTITRKMEGDFFYRFTKTAEGRFIGQLDEKNQKTEAEFDVEVDPTLADLKVLSVEETLMPRICNVKYLYRDAEDWIEEKLDPRDIYFLSSVLVRELFSEPESFCSESKVKD